MAAKAFSDALLNVIKFITLAGLLVALGYLIASKLMPASDIHDTPVIRSSELKYPSIIRLHNNSNEFFCSGAVISDKLAVTANHCVDVGLFTASFENNISVRPPSGEDIGVSAVVVGGNKRSDTAIIRGNFSAFEKRQIISDTRIDLNLLLSNDIALVSCGFPWGDKLFCVTITNRVFYNFLIAASGLLFPGMSGGPVMVKSTGEIVGINTGVKDSHVIISPTASIFTITGAKEP